MSLPPELMVTICSFLSKPDLKASRLVCQQFEQACIPFLFDKVFIAANHADLEISRLISQRFEAYVKELVYDSRLFKDLDQLGHEHEVLRGINVKVDYVPAQDLVTSYIEYRKQFEEQETLLRAGDVVAHLRFAFTNMQKIESVGISHQWARQYPVTSSGEWPGRQFRYRSLQDQRQEKILLHPASPYEVGPGDSDQAKEQAFSSFLHVVV